jgi:type 1 fimbriae regulatory protein FimB
MKRMHPMTGDQLNSVLLAAKKRSQRDYLMLLIASNHGLRASELADIKTADVNLKDGAIWIARKKGSISKSEALLPGEREALSAWVSAMPVSEVLFPSEKGGSLSGVQVYRIFRRYAELAGVPDTCRSPHAFRHSLGQSLADAGMPIKELQIVFGHKSINSTAQYYTKTQAEVDAMKARMLAARA